MFLIDLQWFLKLPGLWISLMLNNWGDFKMKFEKEIIEGVQVIKPYGRIDSNTSHEFEEILNREIEPGRDVEIDFREAVYISSSGLR